ncbi:hypothetical protein [Microbacterium aurum]
MEFSQFSMGDLSEVRDEPVISVTGNTLVPGLGTGPWWGSLLQALQPTEEVADASAHVADQLGEGYVGVQVRAHPTLSHKKTLAESPVPWFIDRMNQLLRERPDLTFFLSCDYPPAQREIIEAVPNVVASTKTGEYNSRQALVESVSDLLVLSRSARILEPYASTFAKIAWLMADRSIPIENSVKSQPAKPSKAM